MDGATVDRVKEDGDLPGALWHIYNTRDADKIRDLLNMVRIASISHGDIFLPFFDMRMVVRITFDFVSGSGCFRTWSRIRSSSRPNSRPKLVFGQDASAAARGRV